MRVVEISQFGGPEGLTLAERSMPVAQAGEIVIKVAFAGVNRPDVMQRKGLYAPPKGASDLPGLEASGTVFATGSGVTEWSVGDRVCALLPGGGYADYVTCPAAHALPVPKALDLKQAAGLPETFFTVWSNVFMRAGLKAGEKFLVHGGSSGIGSTAIMLAKAFGAKVFTTAGTDEKCTFCLSLGADEAINYRESDFIEILTKHGGADVILDMIGGDYLPRNLKALATDGRLQQIAVQNGAQVTLNIAEVMMRRLTIHGSTLRPQSVAAKAKIATSLRENVWPLLDSGRIAPVIDQTFPLADAAKAHAYMESSAHMGKIILEVDPS
ncbi:MAG: NAD(P)H-quinone oxidoreductase [Deltaproteobacteria bacterium]